MTSRYRIAMVAAGPFPAPRGSQVLVRELAEALGANGHSVHVVAYGSGDEMVNAPGVRVHRTPALFGGGLFGPRPWRFVLNLFLLATLFRVVREHGVQLIHAHNYEAPILGYLARMLIGIPVVYHAHNLMGDELEHYYRSSWMRKLARSVGEFLDRAVPRRADRVVALCDGMARDLRHHGVTAAQLEVVPPGIFTESAGHAPGDDPYPGAKVVVYAGNLDPYQDIATLVEAMAEVRRREPRALLVIATHAPEAESRSFADGPGVRVVAAESFQEVQRLLRRADVLACPRASRSGFPIKLLNYMAAGKPIVVSGVLGRSLGDGPWITVAEPGPASLAKAILLALTDGGLRAHLAGESRRLVRDVYDWRRLVLRIEGIYAHVLASPGSRKTATTCEKALQKAAV